MTTFTSQFMFQTNIIHNLIFTKKITSLSMCNPLKWDTIKVIIKRGLYENF